MTLNSKVLGIDAIRATLLRASVEFSAHKMLACEQAPSKGGKKFGERVSGSQSIVTPRAKRVGRGGACRHCFQCTVPPLGD